ncbi:MAG: hypothetical protein GXP09_05705 [Gammaproteobacteria bacterium]|nr:hypothetical protein [Gammaproteobacteria bacterium]
MPVSPTFKLLLAVLATLFGPQPVSASMEPVRHLPQSTHIPLLLAATETLGGEEFTAENAASVVRKRSRGRVLSVETVKQEGQLFYEVKVLLKSGEIRIYHVDTTTGGIQ